YAGRHFGLPAEQALTTMLKASGRGAALQALCDTFGVGRHRLPEMLTVFRSHTPSLWLFHDAEATLCQLRSDGWQLAILTNGLPQVQSVKVHALGLEAFVDHVVFAAEHADGGKPHPAAFHEVLRRFALPAQRCVMVGDDPDCDIRGAREVGVRTIRVARLNGDIPCCADVVLKSLDGIPAAAGSLVQKVTADAA
ncbi:MAG: HAD family hydrolase, partial [Vicinamibacterales bacterium]